MTEKPQKPVSSTIMVVDDNPNNLSLLVDLLSSAGYNVRPVNQGAAALSLAQRQADVIDLILLDILMPEVDGYSVCQQLKADPLTRDIPIIFISALHEEIDKVKAFDCGAVDYLSKPFHAAEVLVRVGSHIDLHHLRKNLERQVEIRTNELQVTNIALRKALDAKQEFLNLLQHELRTPLNVLLGTLNLIKYEHGQITGDQLEMLEEGSSRLLQLGNNLLALNAMGVDFDNADAAFFDVAQVCRECAELFKPVATQKNIEITLSIPDRQILPLPIQAASLRQVLQNVLDNAFKFTPNHGKVSLELFDNPGTFLCHITDTGIGIAPAQREKIFEAFMQLSSGISREYEGAGLGLAVANSLVKLHNGRIRAYPGKEGQGSLFEIMLPYPT